MDRRDLMKYGLGAACVAVAPELLTLPALATGTLTKAPAWPETTETVARLTAMKPLLSKFNNHRDQTALTADEWDALALHHQYYHGMHADSGHFHALDTWFRINETVLKTKYNPTHIDHILNYGTYALSTRTSGGLHQIAGKMRLEPYGRLSSPGHLVNAQYYIGCGMAWDSISSFYTILSLIFLFAGPWELEFIFGILALITTFMGMYECST